MFDFVILFLLQLTPTVRPHMNNLELTVLWGLLQASY